MKLKTFIGPFACKLLLGSSFAQSSLLAPGALTNGYQVTDRGKDFAVIAKIRSSTNAAGQIVSTTNGFTLLENNLHYLDNGAWQVSEDLVEIVPGGAAAQRSPDKALFSSDLNSAAVFDITTSDGLRLQGGVRAIRLTDKATGNSLVIAPVKQSAPGALTPPNQVVYQSGFDGLEADVVYVWKHNSFSQDIVFKQQPALPVGMDPNSTVLEVLTEFVQPPAPALNEQVLQQAGRPDLTDDVTIRFGQTLLLRGNAYAADNTLNFGGLNPADTNATGVLKQWQTLPDGRTFLVESVIWQDIAPLLQNLPAAQHSQKTPRSGDRTAQAGAWPRKAAPVRREPMRMASLPYKPKGFVLDYVSLSGSTSSAIFTNGATFYIQTSYIVGPGAATFQPGCVIKCASNAWMIVDAAISFPDTLQTPVFTSKDDDSFGEVLVGISTDTPCYAASPAISIYYDPGFHEVLSACVRWAKIGVELAANSSMSSTCSVRNCRFENCDTAVYRGATGYNTIGLTNVKKHCVNTPTSGGGIYGSMAEELFYTGTSFAGLNSIDGGQVPDTMGAVGTSYFVELLNGGGDLQSMAAYPKNGEPAAQQIRPADFFAVTYNGTSYPLAAC